MPCQEGSGQTPGQCPQLLHSDRCCFVTCVHNRYNLLTGC